MLEAVVLAGCALGLFGGIVLIMHFWHITLAQSLAVLPLLAAVAGLFSLVLLWPLSQSGALKPEQVSGVLRAVLQLFAVLQRRTPSTRGRRRVTPPSVLG
jgi:hypothetical protein